MKDNKNIKIFCVDDDQFTLRLTEQVLKRLQYTNVSSFESGEECLAHLDESPDLVFMDYQMDGMNGVEALKAIKKHNPSIYVVMFSALENVQIVDETIDLGAFSFLRKEGDLQQMFSAIMEKIGPRVSSIQQFMSISAKSMKPVSYKLMD